MTLSQALLPEFDQEMASTRKCLERIPEARLDWKPHQKSMDLGGLVTHLANLPHWGVLAIEQDSFDMAPVGQDPPRAQRVTSVATALETFDRHVSAARAALAGADDARLMGPWSLLAGGQTVFSMPRAAVLRGMVLNHMIHHRGQLGVYLRMNDVPVPSVYGPSADEST